MNFVLMKNYNTPKGKGGTDLNQRSFVFDITGNNFVTHDLELKNLFNSSYLSTLPTRQFNGIDLQLLRNLNPSMINLSLKINRTFSRPCNEILSLCRSKSCLGIAFN